MRIYRQLIAFVVLAIPLLVIFQGHSLAASDIAISKSSDKTELDADSNNNTARFTINIKNQKKCDIGADIMLAFDRSGSMADDGKNPPQPLTDAKTAAKSFVDSMRVVDYLGIVSYSDNASLDAKLSGSKSPVRQAIDSYLPLGYTNIGDAVKIAREELTTGRDATPKYILLFTDGAANRPFDNDHNKSKKYAYDQAELAKQAGITVITIGLGKGADTTLLSHMASPGQYYYAPTASDMQQIYSRISKSIRGSSPGTVISDDLTSILKIARLVNADNGGKLNGNMLSWDLGDLECGNERQVSFQVELKCLPEAGILNNSANVSNSAGDKGSSNVVNIKYTAPNLTLSYSDNTEMAKVGDTLEYLATVKNMGSGKATNVQLCANLPASAELVSGSISPTSGKLGSDRLVCWNGFEVAPQASREFKFKVKLNGEFAEGYSNITSVATLNNDNCGKVESRDNTQVFLPPKPAADYSVFVNCVEVNADRTSYTAYFGYHNKLSDNQALDVSTLTPPGSGQAPTTLLSGEQNKAFTASSSIDQNISWYSKAGKVERTTTATSRFVSCNDQNQIPDPTINPVPDPGEVVGPIVRSPKQPPVIDNPPIPTITNLVADGRGGNASGGTSGQASANQCRTRTIKADCSAIDDSAVETMQYSLDKGKSWFPVTRVQGLGTERTTCQIETKPLPDGNYDVVLRARDNAAQWGYTEATTVNVDCEGLVIGANHPALYQMSSLVADKNGELVSTTTTPLDLTIEISGGPKSAKVWLKETKQEFELTYNSELHLWQGKISVTTAGIYQLVVTATEQSGESISREINTLRVMNTPNLPSGSFTATVYTRSNSSEAWRAWEGNSYHQAFSRNLDSNLLYATPGEYYISVSSDGYLSSNTNIVRLNHPTYLQVEGELLTNNPLNWLRNIFHELALVVTNDQTLTSPDSPLRGKPAPSITLHTAQEQLDNKIFSGRKTLMLVWNQWSPIAVEQLLELQKIAEQHSDVQVIVVNSLITPDQSRNYLDRGIYGLNFYTTDNSYYQSWLANTLPISYLINDKGTIAAIHNGVLRSDEFTSLKPSLEVLNQD